MKLLLIPVCDRVDSALKDIAIVMKQLDESDETIEAIESFGHLCPSESQESLDNILLELYKEIIGKTDVEIFSEGGVKESQDFKREVLERGVAAKREITFDTKLFGSKTFLIYVEPVFSKAGEAVSVNYMGMDVTDQVRKTEKMTQLGQEIAVKKAKETELNKSIHITEETMRAKQMLATMSHEIRSPLAGVVSMAEILSTSKLDKEQRQLLSVMLSSGDLVLQLINDILYLSKVESGVMRLEATKFRPREVVKHVLQTATASLQKTLTLEGHITNDSSKGFHETAGAENIFCGISDWGNRQPLDKDLNFFKKSMFAGSGAYMKKEHNLDLDSCQRKAQMCESNPEIYTSSEYAVEDTSSCKCNESGLKRKNQLDGVLRHKKMRMHETHLGLSKKENGHSAMENMPFPCSCNQ